MRSFAGFQANSNAASSRLNSAVNSNKNNSNNEFIKNVDAADRGQCSPVNFGTICNIDGSGHNNNNNSISNIDFCLPIANALQQQHQQQQLKLERMSCDL